MEIIYLDENNLPRLNNTSLCLGYFDALHLGHYSLILKAKSLGQKVALLTMEPNPRTFFSPTKIQNINSLETRINILKKINIDYLLILNSAKVISMTKVDFISKIIYPLGVNHLICGYDYTFGKNALGNYQTLLAYQNNHYQVELCKPILNASGMKISSTLIKSLITKGEVKQANSYLMEDFSLSGEVIHGNHLGFQIGFATANVRLDEQYISPRNGVYGGLVKYQDHLYLAMINVGVHPTINQLDTSLLEAHLIDENITLYGETITIYFKTFIREEIKFTSLKALKEELEANKKTIQALSKQENWENC